MRIPLALVLLSAPAFAQQQPSLVAPPQGSVTAPTLGAAPTSLLDGRLSMKLPLGMQVEAPQPGAVSGDHTRASFSVGQGSFSVIAGELYATAPADLVASVTLMAKGEHPSAVAVPSGLKIVGLAPQQAPAGDQSLVYATWVVHPDGHVIQLGFFVDGEAVGSRAYYFALAQQMVQTLTAGSRTLSLKGGEHAFGGTSQLALNLPPSWTTSTNAGADFTVYHLRKVGPIAVPQPTCGIYVGNHPSTFKQRMNGQGTSTQGVLLGQRADWFSFTGQKGEHTTEAIIPHPAQTTLWVHVFCTAPTDAELKPARAAVDTLRVVR